MFQSVQVNENQLRLFNATTFPVKTFRERKLLRSQTGHRSISMINGFLFFSGDSCIGKTLFSERSRNDKFTESSVPSTLAPDIKSWSLAWKWGLNWAMPKPCAADLQFYVSHLLCTTPFCVAIMSQWDRAVWEYIIVFWIVSCCFSSLHLILPHAHCNETTVRIHHQHKTNTISEKWIKLTFVPVCGAGEGKNWVHREEFAVFHHPVLRKLNEIWFTNVYNDATCESVRGRVEILFVHKTVFPSHPARKVHVWTKTNHRHIEGGRVATKSFVKFGVLVCEGS